MSIFNSKMFSGLYPWIPVKGGEVERKGGEGRGCVMAVGGMDAPVNNMLHYLMCTLPVTSAKLVMFTWRSSVCLSVCMSVCFAVSNFT